jgi:hypothetical protein
MLAKAQQSLKLPWFSTAGREDASAPVSGS